MFPCTGTDRRLSLIHIFLAERLNISPEQLKFVTNSPPGEGLLFFENVILPFADKFPRDTELYRIMSTKPNEKF